jgi:toxin ParE1/3/4
LIVFWSALAEADAGDMRLAEFPSLGHSGRVHGTRELVVAGTPYVLCYRVIGEQVHILRAWHAARQWPDRF